jgi:hypothetical protein
MNMKLKFCDGNYELVKEVSKLGIESVHNDYFREALKTPNVVMMTASNPLWTFGGGIDAGFMQNFPELCKQKQNKGGDNERIENICFTQTVGHDFKATKEIVQKALEFAKSTLKENETLLFSGLGVGIGQNSNYGVKEFLEILKVISSSKI